MHSYEMSTEKIDWTLILLIICIMVTIFGGGYFVYSMKKLDTMTAINTEPPKQVQHAYAPLPDGRQKGNVYVTIPSAYMGDGKLQYMNAEDIFYIKDGHVTFIHEGRRVIILQGVVEIEYKQ